MDSTILLFLLQDGITSGAIYALLGLALVLVFAVTRVILIPQGEFVTFGALTYAVLATGKVPGTTLLALGMGVVAFAFDMIAGRNTMNPRKFIRSLALNIVLPLAIWGLATMLAGRQNSVAVNFLLSIIIVAPIGLYLYRIAYQPIAHASVLVLLIASVGVHLALQGLGLAFFGAEGLRAPAIATAAFTVGPLRFTGQSIAIYAITMGNRYAPAYAGALLRITAACKVTTYPYPRGVGNPGGIAQVGAEVLAAATAGRIDFGDRRSDLLRRAEAVDRDPGTGRGQRMGDGEADAGGAAGHQRGAALQEVVAHEGSVLRCIRACIR